jgi:hypothetical protein
MCHLTDTRFLLALRASLIGLRDFSFGLSVTRLRPFFCEFLLEMFRIFSSRWSFLNFSEVIFRDVFALVGFFFSAFKRRVIHPFFDALCLFLDSLDAGAVFFLEAMVFF